MSRLPRRVLFICTNLTIAGVVAVITYSLLSGWIPPRQGSGVVLPFYFSGLLAVLTASFVISGDTLMHHFRTGTVRRETSPRWFWSIVAVQSVLAVVLFVIGWVNWKSLKG